MTLETRVISGLIVSIGVVVILLIGGYFPGGTYLTGLAALAVVGLSSWEFGSFHRWESRDSVYRYVASGVNFLPSLIILMACLIGGAGSQYTVLSPLFRYFVLSALFTLALTISIILFRRRVNENDGVSAEFSLLFSVAYLGLGGGALTTLALLPGGTRLLGWMIAVASFQDIAAYFGGKKFGSTPLAPALSPKKTLGGAFSGLLGAFVAGVILQGLLDDGVSVVVLSLLVGIGSQAGDLAESFLKRLSGVKDAGSLIPGHGGVFDRIDSHLGAAFVVVVSLLMGELLT